MYFALRFPRGMLGFGGENERNGAGKGDIRFMETGKF
jgi:hypothetical protein